MVNITFEVSLFKEGNILRISDFQFKPTDLPKPRYNGIGC